MKPTKKQLDRLWADCVKARAGYKSELSNYDGGEAQSLHAHHISGKPNYSLRWDLKNGVCLTGGEHFFKAHDAFKGIEFRKWALKLRKMSEREVQIKGKKRGTVDLWAMHLYLTKKLKEFKRARKNKK